MSWFTKLFSAGVARADSINERTVYREWYTCLSAACGMKAQQDDGLDEAFTREALYVTADLIGKRHGLSR